MVIINKSFELGLFCGRFQHIHKGHQHIINIGLQLCDRLLILVGSAQEKETKRNPLPVSTRINLIKQIYNEQYNKGQLIVKPLNDISDDPENDITPKWGKYVLDHVEKYTGRYPDFMIYGNDEARSKWFDKKDIKDLNELIITRTNINISATRMRKFLAKNKKKDWKRYADPSIYEYYDNIRNELLKVNYYNNIKNN